METIFECNELGCSKEAILIGKCKWHAREEVRRIREQETQKPVNQQGLSKEWTSEILLERMRDGWELRQGPTAVHLVKDKKHIRIHPKYFHELLNDGKLVKVGETSRGKRTSIYTLKEDVCQKQ